MQNNVNKYYYGKPSTMRNKLQLKGIAQNDFFRTAGLPEAWSETRNPPIGAGLLAGLSVPEGIVYVIEGLVQVVYGKRET